MPREKSVENLMITFQGAGRNVIFSASLRNTNNNNNSSNISSSSSSSSSKVLSLAYLPEKGSLETFSEG